MNPEGQYHTVPKCNEPGRSITYCAQTIATAVMRQLEMSGRLLPAPERPAMPSTSAVGHMAAEPELQADASSVDIDGVG